MRARHREAIAVVIGLPGRHPPVAGVDPAGKPARVIQACRWLRHPAAPPLNVLEEPSHLCGRRPLESPMKRPGLLGVRSGGCRPSGVRRFRPAGDRASRPLLRHRQPLPGSLVLRTASGSGGRCRARVPFSAASRLRCPGHPPLPAARAEEFSLLGRKIEELTRRSARASGWRRRSRHRSPRRRRCWRAELG